MTRAADLARFYDLLAQLEEQCGGKRLLGECHGRQEWPERGIYFFFEPGEYRPDGVTPRVVRVGVNAISTGSQNSLWKRLYGHRGTAQGSGNHRGSIFRLRVGEALQAQAGNRCSTWAQGSSAPRAVREAEAEFEQQVSRTLGQFSVLWLGIPDEPGPQSQRALLERQCLALLSHVHPETDAPSPGWLGHHAQRAEIRESGLWNSDHVRGEYDPAFLDVLEGHICS
ncbi:hypothetical protein [Deinococcus fonticola]|uniref:hypothetical protein n=1 Tax=Deinococcus fonticola TaxID=2528713 RepID=UPI00197AB735|nr:hypothetical protein [Deinococcus fonticola]